MDKAPIRRGKPTVYKKWDANRAILSGDTMMVMAYDYILASPKDEAVKDYEFYEVVTENLGIKLRLFFEENEAIAWLAANRSADNQELKKNNLFSLV